MTDNSGPAQVGIIGLVVMGSNIARSFTYKRHTVTVYNRSPKKTRTFIAEHGDGDSFIPSETVEEFVASLEHPHRVLIVVQAGATTDTVIDQLADVTEPGDIIIDGGDSLCTDIIRRERAIRARGLHYVGTGAFGGEEGALTGPSIAPDGMKKSYESLGPLLESISAHIDDVLYRTHISSDDVDHFVRMVHSDIEYTDMRVVGEAYRLLHEVAGFTPAEITDIFRERNKGGLDSYLAEITAEVLFQADEKTGKLLVDAIVDATGQKGIDRWAIKAVLDLDIPVTGIEEAVFARASSSSLAQHEAARSLPSGNLAKAPEDRDAFMERVRKALCVSKIIAYLQGFGETNAGAKECGWEIDRGTLTTIWHDGCIIRAQLLNRIEEAHDRDLELPVLVLDEYFRDQVTECLDAWHDIVITAAQMDIPAPVLSSSLAYYDGPCAEHLPTALAQGQYDCFGAHTYRCVDRKDALCTLRSGGHSEVEA